MAYFSVKLVRYAFYFLGAEVRRRKPGHSDALASTVTAAAMPIGGLVGVIAAGYVSDKVFQARRAPVISSLALGRRGRHAASDLSTFDNIWV